MNRRSTLHALAALAAAALALQQHADDLHQHLLPAAALAAAHRAAQH